MAEDKDAEEQPEVETVILKSSMTKFSDNFTLTRHSSNVNFDDRNVTIFPETYSQMHLIDRDPTVDDDPIEVKRVSDTNPGTVFLRFLYAIVALVFTFFMATFSIMILVYVGLQFAIEVGLTTVSTGNAGNAVPIIFALPVLVVGMAETMVMCVHFVYDSFHGSRLLKLFVSRRFYLGKLVSEWVVIMGFIGIPALVLSFGLVTSSEDFWSDTAVTWFSCVVGIWIVFVVGVIVFEVRACIEVARNISDEDLDTPLNLINRCVKWRQERRYCGIKTCSFIQRGKIVTKPEGEPFRVSYDMWSKPTKWLASKDWGLMEDLEVDGSNGEQFWHLNDARHFKVFLTGETWSLDKLFCRDKDGRNVAIVAGPGALSRAQIKSSAACLLVGHTLIGFLVVSALVWLGSSAAGIIGGLVYAYYVKQQLLQVREVLRTVQDITDSKVSTRNLSEESEAVYLVQQSYLVTRPSSRAVWISVFVELFFFVIYPIYGFISLNNSSLIGLFIGISIVTCIRRYFNASYPIEKVGDITKALPNTEKDSWSKWRELSRLDEILVNITRARSKGAWMGVFGVFAAVILILFLGAVVGGNDTASTEKFKTLNDFYYPQIENLPYPTCKLGKDFSGKGDPIVALRDWTYLAGAAYLDNDITQGELDKWFGEGVAYNNITLVDEFRTSEDGDNYTSAVHFKLVEVTPDSDFPDMKYALLLIRGTTNAWDALADAQLWGAAALMQFMRFLLPFGEIWTPLLDNLNLVISGLASDMIERVAFYRTTVDFVHWLEKTQFNKYQEIFVTGHSLGGGLSIITGALTKSPAIALSGPNAIISRRTFVEEISIEALNQYTFNIIPERDVVPRFDDVARLYQHIACTASTNDFVGCHSAVRSLCEIMYTCGTDNRPALCECYELFGYPKPDATGNRTFEEACAAEF